MTYQVPIQDIRFVLRELADLSGVLALPGFEEVSDDLVDAVLEENARFVEQEIAPLNRTGDTQPARWQDGAVRTTPGFQAAFRAFAQGGWQGLPHDAEFGGQGLPKLVSAPVTESLNAGNLSFSLCPLLTDGVIEALSMVGTAEQKSRFIPPLLEGRWTGTMNLTEPQAGSDLALLKTRAVRQDDGSYRLSGQKIFITYGDHDLAENIIHLVLARTPDAPKGVKGISLFIVPKFLVNDDGGLGKRNDVYCASLEHKLGIHGSPTAVLLYGSGKGEVGEGAVGYLIGEENRGLEYMFIMMNAARYAVGLQGVAVSERALQHAAAYAAERVQGNALEGSDGPVPIARHPDVARMLGVMRGLTEGARAVAYVAAGYRDKAAHAADESVRAQARAIYEYSVPIVKAFSTESSVEVASLGVQVHGGMGFIEETGAAQYYRDARILPIYEGTTAIQANDFIGRKIVRDGGKVAREQIAGVRDTVAALRAAGGAHADALELIAQRLEDAARAYEAAVDFVLGHIREDIRGVFTGSVPCLMLAGTVHAGWQLGRAALAAAAAIRAGAADPFNAGKIATAVQYAAHVLPRAAALNDAIQAGGLADRYVRQARI
ncbi:acyl-CoA dehydrogenase [uncultured Castellaniella sp.]|uniref:acyl-CoA dehydrogenase n=1 Tax=uncultured Castellaniella sp. TaxID=647907 RepID=UPI0026160C53|nr:acyl-CoA dehydrogenase [uncultured Castellaniella sp.]